MKPGFTGRSVSVSVALVELLSEKGITQQAALKESI